MRVRSEWITLFTVTSLALCGLALPKHAATPEGKRKDIAAAGVDFTPTATVRRVDRRSIRRQQP